MELVPHGQANVHRIHTLLIDDCVFFRDDIIFMVYIDYGIFLGSDDMQLHDIIKEIQDLLTIEDQGNLDDYVGAIIKKLKDGSFEFTPASTTMAKTPAQQGNNANATMVTLPAH
jgi:hypothetical protein